MRSKFDSVTCLNYPFLCFPSIGNLKLFFKRFFKRFFSQLNWHPVYLNWRLRHKFAFSFLGQSPWVKKPVERETTAAKHDRTRSHMLLFCALVNTQWEDSFCSENRLLNNVDKPDNVSNYMTIQLLKCLPIYPVTVLIGYYDYHPNPGLGKSSSFEELSSF